ncbi:MAG: M23 family metallopeptidase, partial [Arenimonas sp.]
GSPMRTAFAPLLLLFAALPAGAAEPLQVSITVAPGQPLIERMGGTQLLNFDLVVANQEAAAVDIDRVELSVFDRAGALLLRRSIDGNGVRPSIAVLGGQRIEAGQRRLLFNPFDTLAGELDVARLDYVFELSNADGSVRSRELVQVSPRSYRNHAAYRLPLQGRQLNHDGHDAYGHHRRFDVEFAPIQQMGFKRNAMRYSYDFVPVDASGGMFAGDFKTNADWFGFGDDIHAIGEGVVVAVENTRPDDRQFDQNQLASDKMVLFGNYVVIDHGGGEFGVYAHAQQGSVAVKVGDKVAQGAVVAKVGASGSANFPHLHFQLQSGPDLDAEALPSYFNGYSRLLGAKRVARRDASVETGEIVETD